MEKLPPEVRHMIFRFAMPDDRFEPLHEPGHDWNKKFDDRMLGFGDCMEQETEPQAIPYSLFDVQGFIANEALAVFHNEVFFRMDISLFGIRTRGHLMDQVVNFKNHKTLAQWTEFENRRKYHLNIESNAVNWAGGGDGYRDPYTYEHGSYRIKEWIRLVSDELLAKNIIQILAITAPCRCALKAAGLLPKDEASILDPFTPLKRTHVPNPVTLSLHDDGRKNGIASPCIKPACLQLSQHIQTMLGRLDGEPLSEQEAIWKDCKSRYCDDLEMEKKVGKSFHDNLYTSIGSVWEALSGIHPWDTTFEEAVQKFRKRLVNREQAREEKREQARKEEQEMNPEKEHQKEQS